MDIRHKDIPAKKLNIALVDNEKPVYAAVRGLMEAIGEHSVAHYVSPESFVGSARAEDFDCILLDYMFPPGGMDGMDMLKHLAGLGCQTPVVMVTSKDRADHLDTFEMGRLGAKALLLKPFVASQLKDALQKAMLATPAQAQSTAPAPDIWGAGDLEESSPVQLDAAGFASLRRRAQTRFNPAESGKFETLTLTETKVFLFRAQHGGSARDMADSLGMKENNLNAHIDSAARKLGTRAVLKWRDLFDKLK